jgi:cell wall-associated NlpC family hydrolase
MFLTVVNAYASGSGVVNGTNVNVRSLPSTSADVGARLHQGDGVAITRRDGEWYSITYNDTAAYVNASFVSVVSARGVVSADSVNIRTAPGLEGAVVAMMGSGEEIDATGISGDFYAFERSGATVYIHKDFTAGVLYPYLSAAAGAPTERYAVIVAAGGVNFRSGPSVDASAISLLPTNSSPVYIAQEGEWYKVSVSGSEGYVKAEFAELRDAKPPAAPAWSSTGSAIADYGLQFLGTPYSYGGTNLNSGVDCSGFVYSVYGHFGIKLNRRSSDQINNGVRIDQSQLQPGDLIFFDTTGSNDGGISHVGISIGGGKFVHSSSGSTYAVMVSSLSEAYYIRTYVAACRVV